MNFSLRKFLSLGCSFGLVSCGFFLGGCKHVSFLSAPIQNRGIKGLCHDTRLRLRINNFLLAEKEFMHCSLLIHDGHVVLVGFVKDERSQRRILDFIENLEGVKKFINHLAVGVNTQKTYGKDVLMTRRLESSLFFDGKVQSRNFDVLIFNRIAYIVGIAKNEEEKKRVLRHANNLALRKVEEHIRIKENLQQSSENFYSKDQEYLSQKNHNSQQNAEKVLEKNWQQDEEMDHLKG